MIEEEGGSLIIQSEGKEKNGILDKMTLQEIGVKKREVERGEKNGVVRGEVIVEIIEGVQNDDTASITLSTSCSVNRGNTGIDTISSQSCSVNSNCPLFPCG